MEVLAAHTPNSATAVRTGIRKAFVMDGTLLSIDRIATDRPFCSGRHEEGRWERWPARVLFRRPGPPSLAQGASTTLPNTSPASIFR